MKGQLARWIKVVVLLWVGAVVAGPSRAAAQAPNVIVIVADDLGWNDVGYHGGNIDTPSLDRLAREGAQLDRFYATPVCSPTRAALMTGRDPIALGVAYGVILPWDNHGVHPDEHFMPESFRAAGYQTAMVGKWHLGHAQMTYHPNNRGFEHFYGHLHTQVGYYPPFAHSGGRDFQRNGQSINDQGYETFLLAAEASRYIRERDRDRPFFVYLPFIAPHTPLDAPPELLEKYQDIDTNLKPSRVMSTDRSRAMAKAAGRPSARPAYAAVVDAMDQAIGQVLTTLDEEGLTDNTIVLFFSDNGGATYSVGGADNYPLRGGKSEAWEGGIRVISLLRWPAKINPGTVVKGPISVMDVFPTLAAAAGIRPRNQRPLDGHNQWPLISEGKGGSVADRALYFASEVPISGSFYFGVIQGPWKLVQQVDQDPLNTRIQNALFRLDRDPLETTDLSDHHPDQVTRLAEQILRWRARYPINGTRNRLSPPPGWRAPKDWASYPRPLSDLQPQSAASMAPDAALERMLDAAHGQRGRLIYDCQDCVPVPGPPNP